MQTLQVISQEAHSDALPNGDATTATGVGTGSSVHSTTYTGYAQPCALPDVAQ